MPGFQFRCYMVMIVHDGTNTKINGKHRAEMTYKSFLSSSYRNPWLIMPMLVLIVYGIFLAAQWSLAGNSLYGFISFNEKRVDAAESNIPPKFVSKKFGYDGQFYYRLALDPLSTEAKVQGLSIDNPAWRQQRILLSALTWLFARGDPQGTAVVMLAINLLAVAGLTLVGGALLRSYGLSPWPALLLAFYPGFAISIERFLCEPLTSFLIMLSLLCLVHKKLAWGGLLLALAVLAREAALAVALAMAGIWFLQTLLRLPSDRFRAPGPVFWLPAMLTHLCWQWWLQQAWSTSAFAAAEKGKLLVWPLSGLIKSFLQLVSNISIDNLFFLIMMLTVILWVVKVGSVFRKSYGPFRWVWFAYLLLTTLLGTAIWNNSPGFMRITTELNILGLIMVLLVEKKPRRWIVVGWLGCWLMTAGAEGYRLHLIEKAKTVNTIELAYK